MQTQTRQIHPTLLLTFQTYPISWQYQRILNYKDILHGRISWVGWRGLLQSAYSSLSYFWFVAILIWGTHLPTKKNLEADVQMLLFSLMSLQKGYYSYLTPHSPYHPHTVSPHFLIYHAGKASPPAPEAWGTGQAGPARRDRAATSSPAPWGSTNMPLPRPHTRLPPCGRARSRSHGAQASPSEPAVARRLPGAPRGVGARPESSPQAAARPARPSRSRGFGAKREAALRRPRP